MTLTDMAVKQFAEAAWGAKVDHIEGIREGRVRVFLDNGAEIDVNDFTVTKQPKENPSRR